MTDHHNIQAAVAAKLENIISGHRVNEDDAAWLRSFTQTAIKDLSNSPPAGMGIPHNGPSTYEQRFAEAVRLLTGATPPADMVAGWIDPRVDDHRLQDWIGLQKGTPCWAQNIAIADAAHVIAEQPVEGEEHLSATPPSAEAADLVMVDMVPPATARDRWMYEQGRLAERDARTHAIEAASSPVALQGRHPLEAYAESYDQMSRMGDGRIAAYSVATDIRQNMIPKTQAARSSLPAPTTSGQKWVDEFYKDKGYYPSLVQAFNAGRASLPAPQADAPAKVTPYNPTEAMRCYVASKLGETVEVPEELK